MQTLTTVADVWSEIKSVAESSQICIPSLPHTVNCNALALLSSDDLQPFGLTVMQIRVSIHLIIDDGDGSIYKLVTDPMEKGVLREILLKVLLQLINPPKHFIVPKETSIDVFKYDKVCYGPLN